jgi:hypothetical protein
MTTYPGRLVLLAAAAALVGGASSAFALEKLTSSSGKAAEAEQAGAKMAARIDALLEEQWAANEVKPAPVADDAEFLRRASLDLTGVIPRASEVREFLADELPDKRQQLVDRLLASPRYATHMATTWRNRILPAEVDPSRARQAVALQKW